jgi:endonuclease I
MKFNFLVTLVFVFISATLFGQGNETFSNAPATGATYTTINWTGNNGLAWSATSARTDQIINGTAVTIRDATGNIVCNNIPNGCGTLTFNYVRAFTTGSPSVSVYINGVQTGASFSSTSATVQQATVNANVSGTFNLEIRQTVVGTSNRMIIDDVAWTASGPLCTPPTIQATAATISSITSNSFSINWTGGNGTNSLVVLKQGSAVAGVPNSGTTYTANSVFGSGQTIAAGEYVVYNGTGTSIAVTGLSSGTTYYASVFTYNNADNCYNTTSPATTNASTSCASPTVQVSTITITPASTNASISWSGGNGSSTLVKLNSANSFTAPVDGTTYTGNTVYSSGEQIIYVGTGSSVNVTGLTAATTYYVTAYTFNPCGGVPDYLTTGNVSQSFVTTSGGSGIPAGYYNAATGLTCAALKTALATIVTTGMTPKTYGDLWTQYLISDVKPREVGPGTSPNVIWDVYSDNPTGTDPYNFTPGTVASGGQQDNGGAASTEGVLYNREHSVPQSWFGASAASGSIGPESDYFHVFPTDKVVNANRGNFIYGTVSAPTITSANGGKLGPNTFTGLSGTAFEPIDAFKGDLARGFLYFVTRYQSNMVGWEALSTEGDKAFDGTTWPSVEPSYLQLMIQWHNLDPVSQKEVDRNNAGYTFQGNRNPFIDHPEYVGAIWAGGCSTLPVSIISFTANFKLGKVVLDWQADGRDDLLRFEIERSVDNGRTFSRISNLLPSLTSDKYQYSDDVNGISNTVQYRLKIINNDFTYKYSNVVSVNINARQETLFTVFPNPSHGDMIQVLPANPATAITAVSIIDMTGRVILDKVFTQNQPGSKQLYLGSLVSGKYILKIASGDKIGYSPIVIMK